MTDSTAISNSALNVVQLVANLAGGGAHVCSGACYKWKKKSNVTNCFKIFVKIFVHNSQILQLLETVMCH